MQKYNVISFSLWGPKQKYRFGAFENIKLAKEIYPDWKVRFYIDQSIELEFAKKLHEAGAQVYQVKSGTGAFEGMYWRFWVNDDPEVNHYCIRDADSRLNWREKAAVDEWLKSGNLFHTMRDHKNHVFHMQGGMWGGTTGFISNMKNQTFSWNHYEQHGVDQYFLEQKIWPRVKNTCTVHDPYFDKKPFPKHKPLPHPSMFVGQIFDEHNNYFSE
jgi:hypothetical protein